MAACEDSLLPYWGWPSSSSESVASWRPLASSLQTEEETATVEDVVGTASGAPSTYF